MNRRVALREICHSRTGDKADSVTLSLIPYDPDHYEFVRGYVTAERVKEYFGNMVEGTVERYEVPNIAAFNFVLNGALDGGCHRSLRPDQHGKALSGAFLDLEVDLPANLDLPRLGEFGFEPASGDS